MSTNTIGVLRGHATQLAAAVPAAISAGTAVDRWVHGGVLPPTDTLTAAISALLALAAHQVHTSTVRQLAARPPVVATSSSTSATSAGPPLDASPAH